MQVRCPYCSSVFEADRAGVRFCPSCGKQIQVPEAPAPSAAPTPEPLSPGSPGPTGTGGSQVPPSTPRGREPTPWERRAELGVLKGLVETWRRTMFMPEPFWSSLKPDGPPGDALGYAWIIWLVAGALRFPIAWQSAESLDWFRKLVEKFGNLPPETQKSLEILSSIELHPIRIALYGSMTFVLAPLWLLIGSALVHLFCMLLGCAKNGYWATFRAFAYASAPGIAVGIPCLGALASIYMVVLQIWGVSKIQDTSIGKATGAVLGPFVALCCCGCLAGMAFSALLGSLLSSLFHS